MLTADAVSSGDWVALYATGASATNYGAWQYLNGLQTMPASGSSGAVVTFTMPTAPGTYELRFSLNDSYTVLATRATVTVQ
jgi:hypothetical protein